MNGRLIGGLLVLAHGAIADWHLIVAASAVPTTAPTSLTLPVTLIALMHVIIAFAVWMVPPRAGGWILTIFFVAALTFDLYEHFLGAVPNNIFRVASGPWTPEFRVSVFLLLLTELLGLWSGIRLRADRSVVSSRAS